MSVFDAATALSVPGTFLECVCVSHFRKDVSVVGCDDILLIEIKMS